MKMTIQEIYDLCPYGATIKFSDGTPRPPERFNKKLTAWKRTNGQGFFVKSDPPYNYKGATGGISLQLVDTDHFIYTQGFCLTSALSFDVELAPPGTVMPYSEWRDSFEVAHVHKDINDYFEWCRRNRYVPFKHGRKLWIVNEKGEREELKETPAVVA